MAVEVHGVRVSEHALLRYIERVAGVDMQKLAEHFVTEEIAGLIRLGARKIPIEDGLYIIAENGAVLTVRPALKKKRRRARERDLDCDETPMNVFVHP